jgi:hypothetical protein
MVLSEDREHKSALINLPSAKNPVESNDNKSHRDVIKKMVENSNLTILTRSSDPMSEKAIARCLFSVYALAEITGYDICAILDDMENDRATDQTREQFRQLEAAAFRSPISRWSKKAKRAKLTRH